MSIRQMLRPESRLARNVSRGMQALKPSHRSAITVSRTTVLDSLDLDSATRHLLPIGRRWDYLLGTSRRQNMLVGVEVHPARANQVRPVIEKKRAAHRLLRDELIDARCVRCWLWIASGRSTITRTGPEARLLALAGVRFVGRRLHLEKELGSD